MYGNDDEHDDDDNDDDDDDDDGICFKMRRHMKTIWALLPFIRCNVLLYPLL